MIAFAHDESSSLHYHMTMCLLHFHDVKNVWHVSKTCFFIETKSNILHLFGKPLWCS
jgi:hypothetical protein